MLRLNAFSGFVASGFPDKVFPQFSLLSWTLDEGKALIGRSLLILPGPVLGPSTGQASDEGEILIQAYLGLVFTSYVISLIAY